MKSSGCKANIIYTASHTMPQITKAPMLYCPTAAKLQDCLVVFGGILQHVRRDRTLDKIWVYNLYTETWMKYRAKGWFALNMVTDDLLGCCTVSIGTAIYVLPVKRDNVVHMEPTLELCLWKLQRDRKGCFSWNEVPVNISPSDRRGMTGWAYAGKIFTFGGATLYRSPPAGVGHLNDFGEFGADNCTNNQLHCFDTSSQEWSNQKTSGTVPCPRLFPSSTAIDDKAWLFGGHLAGTRFSDLYELNMPHLIWTQIETPQPLQAELLKTHYISAITRNQLVVHGTKEKANTFILDLTSLSWKEYKMTVDYYKKGQAIVPGLDSTVMMVMGKNGECGKPMDYNSTRCIRLAPMSLQQLAIKTVHKHRAALPYENLPWKLLCKIEGIYENIDKRTPNSKALAGQ